MCHNIVGMYSTLRISSGQRMIDMLNYTQKTVGVHVSILIHVSSTTSVSMLHAVYVNHWDLSVSV